MKAKLNHKKKGKKNPFSMSKKTRHRLTQGTKKTGNGAIKLGKKGLNGAGKFAKSAAKSLSSSLLSPLVLAAVAVGGVFIVMKLK